MVTIVPYQPNWPDEFQQLGSVLRQALGKSALRIDHIGSTAVPHLAAKDRIDIQLTVAALTPAVEQALNEIGYTRHVHLSDHPLTGSSTDPDEWTKWVFKPPIGQRPTNLHVRIAGRANQRFALLFRDFVRRHPAYAAAYAAVKQQLAQHLADSTMYSVVKQPSVELIYFAAEKWAAEKAWQPGASDA